MEEKAKKKLTVKGLLKALLVVLLILVILSLIIILGGKGNKKAYRVGDCVAIGNLRTVIWRAWDVCMKI